MAHTCPAVMAGLLIAATILAAPADAQIAANPSTMAFGPSFREWMVQHQVPAASIATMKDGRLMSTLGIGGMEAATPVPIASLSKAITAVCIGQLVDAGRLSFTASIGGVLEPTFARRGQPLDPRFKTITI